MPDSDDSNEDEWPNDDEANDVMLAYAATDDSHSSVSGCAGVLLILILTMVALLRALA